MRNSSRRIWGRHAALAFVLLLVSQPGNAAVQCDPRLICGWVQTQLDTGYAPAPSYWTHNGSLVYLVANGNERRFYYENPRDGMRAVGARPGTLLFIGRRQGFTYIGQAYIFTTRCGAIPYPVNGIVTNDDHTVTLRGYAPSRFNDRCDAISYKDDVLIFNFIQ